MKAFEEWWEEHPPDEYPLVEWITARVLAKAAWLAATERAAGIAEDDCSKKSRAHEDGFCSCVLAQKIREE